MPNSASRRIAGRRRSSHHRSAAVIGLVNETAVVGAPSFIALVRRRKLAAL